jgi:hypothetical protein
MIITEWKCPYCELSGETEYDKTAFYDLTKHMADVHPDETYNDILNKYDIKQYLLSGNTAVLWRLAGKHIRTKQ